MKVKLDIDRKYKRRYAILRIAIPCVWFVHVKSLKLVSQQKLYFVSWVYKVVQKILSN